MNRSAAAPETDLKSAIDARFAEAVALMLWDFEAVEVRPHEPFRLASGGLSPIYVNCRRVISEPAFMELFCAAARWLCERRGVEFEVVAGGETAGIPFGAYLASSLGRRMVYVRKQSKGHGLAGRVEGGLAPGSRVLLVEDLITDGGSKLGFLDALGEAGGEVRDVLVLFDRQQGGTELLAGRGVTLHAVSDRASVLATGIAAGCLTPDAREVVEDYFRDPAAWQPA